jgi:hypothetical protein
MLCIVHDKELHLCLFSSILTSLFSIIFQQCFRTWFPLMQFLKVPHLHAESLFILGEEVMQFQI